MKTFFVLAQYYNPVVYPDLEYTRRINYNMFRYFKGQTTNLSKLSLRMAGVKLVNYDLLGREVATLVNEELKPGTYEADWDGSNFSSGVYFYKLVAGDPSTTAEAVSGSGQVFTETKKMVLMK